MPRRAALSRTVGGQLPVDFDPLRWGIPASMAEGMDTIAAWNLVTAVDAFLSAGFSPAELLRAVHPGDVACTQGTGFGGMESMRKMFVDRFGQRGVVVFMLFPQGRMSDVQRAQMYSLDDANIHNIVVDGVFDDFRS